jgi:hypothetical protein
MHAMWRDGTESRFTAANEASVVVRRVCRG